MSSTETPEATITRLQAELATARDRANTAESQLLQVQQAVRAFKEKRERVVEAKRAHEAREREERAKHPSAPQSEPPPNRTGSTDDASWQDPDPTLDERLTKYLDSSFEPDRSRKWMLEP